jgi:hypothetical protein
VARHAHLVEDQDLLPDETDLERPTG